MSTTPSPPEPPEEPRRPFQFSMATLMGVVTLVAVGLAIPSAVATWVALVVAALFELAFIGALVAGALFTVGDRRAFCIAALATYFLAQRNLSHVISADTPLASLGLGGSALLNAAVSASGSLFAGWVCVRARRYWEQLAA